MSQPAPLKARLLDAALDALRELDPESLLHAVGAREIARRAGASSPASINQHYGSLAGLAEAVLARVFDTSHLNVPKINALIAHIKDSTLPLPVAFAMHEAEFTRLTTDDEFKLRMGMWALGGEAANARYRDYLSELTAQLENVITELFASWGRELRPPIDVASYLAIKLALVNGVTVRQLADPEHDRLHLFQRSTVAIDLVLLRVLGDRHDLDARLAEMNYYPLEKKRVGTADRSRRTEARILRAANELFATQGFEATGTEQIARYADTSPSTLKRYYPTKQALAIALFARQVAEHQVARPVASGSLSEHLVGLVELARSRMVLASAYLGYLSAASSDAPTDPLVAGVQRHLPDPEADDAAELAETVVLLVLRRAVTHPAEPAESSVGLVLQRLGLLVLAVSPS